MEKKKASSVVFVVAFSSVLFRLQKDGVGEPSGHLQEERERRSEKEVNIKIPTAHKEYLLSDVPA